MIPMRLDEIAGVVRGDVHGDPALEVTGHAYVDNRSPVAGGLFVAILGERVDGHEYAAGAHAVLGSRPTDAPTVVVADPVVALGRLARHVVDRTPATLLALTGSVGKTGTKDYLAAVLERLAGRDRVAATEGNGNNELGVPLTVLRAGATTDYLVVEMGARGIGHIAYLCEVAPPRISAALNVGSAHVGEFGGREQIALAKGEIVEALPADGVAVLNADDPLVAAMASRTQARIVTFGRKGAVRYDAMELDALGRPGFTLVHGDEAHPVRLLQTGAHQAQNATAAAAMAVAAGFPLADVAAALSQVTPASRWRMEVHERADGLVVVNDAYNASPDSMRAALEALAAIGRAGGRRTIAVLGQMLELGTEHEAGHRSVGTDAVRLGVDVVVVVGEPAAPIAEAIAAADGPVVIRTEGRDEALAWVRQNAGSEDVVLIKASRGAALEWVAERLLGDPGGPDDPR
jgi:UDP-N-acetylmuramoyl-tripeptide--D-alanyl-D-alanine ligase